MNILSECPARTATEARGEGPGGSLHHEWRVGHFEDGDEFCFYFMSCLLCKEIHNANDYLQTLQLLLEEESRLT